MTQLSIPDAKSSFISYGAGIQTFAMLILLERGQIDVGEVIFADTGAEHQETYNHIENVVKPICEKVGVAFTTVRMAKTAYPYEDEEREHPQTATSLTELVEIRSRIPSLRNRWCTEASKITPIKMYVREQQKKGTYVKPAKALLGISTDEMDRQFRPHFSEYTVEYPLLKLGMSRVDCIFLIKRSGYPLPPKSGCYFCPFQGLQEWHELYKTDRDRFRHARSLEEHDPKFPTYSLARYASKPLPLREMEMNFENQEFMKEIQEKWRKKAIKKGEGTKRLIEFESGGDELNPEEQMACAQRGYCHV